MVLNIFKNKKRHKYTGNGRMIKWPEKKRIKQLFIFFFNPLLYISQFVGKNCIFNQIFFYEQFFGQLAVS